MSTPVVVSHFPQVQVVVTSFWYRHLRDKRPRADITVDVREHLRDPHVEPALRVLTGHDGAVVARVLDTPGAEALIEALVATAAALLPAACRAGRLVSIAVGCVGGRHRSAVIADAVAARLALAKWGAEAEHVFAGCYWPQLSGGTSGPTCSRLQSGKDGRKGLLRAGFSVRPPAGEVGPNPAGLVGPEQPGKNTLFVHLDSDQVVLVPVTDLALAR